MDGLFLRMHAEVDSTTHRGCKGGIDLLLRGARRNAEDLVRIGRRPVVVCSIIFLAGGRSPSVTVCIVEVKGVVSAFSVSPAPPLDGGQRPPYLSLDELLGVLDRSDTSESAARNLSYFRLVLALLSKSSHCQPWLMCMHIDLSCTHSCRGSCTPPPTGPVAPLRHRRGLSTSWTR